MVEKLNIEKWEKVFNGMIGIDNDANDYYYSWITFESPEGNLQAILEEWLDINYTPKKVRVKVMDGAIFIEVI